VYGLVNKAVEELARQVAGEEGWQRIRARAEVREVDFVGLTAYPDELTYRLVAAASEELGMPAEDVLAAFGEHWVTYTAEQGWGPILTTAGDTLPAFLLGLDAMHARVRLTMPSLAPPSFRCTDVTDTSLRLHYHSHRDGLAAMVTGLVRGLGVRFGTPVQVVHAVRRSDGAHHDEFLVSWP
jgi:uncharacterized protein (TIGR02265 family)